MTSINDQQDKSKRKRGDMREDGRLFFCYRGDGREVWVTPEQMAHKAAKAKERNNRYLQSKRAAGIKPENPLKRGFVREDGMVFWAYGNNGNENWCTAEEAKERAEKARLVKKKFHTTHREEENARSQKWREKNPKKFKESVKASREKFKDERAAATKQWRQINANHVYAYKKKYCEENRDKIRANEMERYRTDPLFNLAKRVRRRVAIAIRDKGYAKTSTTQGTLGCDWATLKKHIEDQFTEGMHWGLMGEIEIDHILPLAAAKTEEQLLNLAHYKNLAPLWRADNRRKHAKLPEDFIDKYDALCKLISQRA
jgi:hypothetical protein